MEILPTELLENIFKRCKKDDLLSVACCNKQHCSLVTPFLWRKLFISLSDPYFPFTTHTIHKVLRNLRHTSTLTIDGNYYGAEEDPHKVNKRSLAIGLMLSKLLSFLDPLKVTTLVTCGSVEVLESVLDVLCNVKSLELEVRDTAQMRGEMISELTQLEALQLSGRENITDDILKDMLFKAKLEKLTIERGDLLTNNAVVTVSRCSTLTHLEMHLLNSSIEVLDVKPLCQLINLTVLGLHARLSGDSMRLLYKALPNLTVIDLSQSTLGDKALEDIHSLTSLTLANLLSCQGITIRDLIYFTRGPVSLQKIYFSSDICQEFINSPDAAVGSLLMLNELKTLKEVHVHTSDNVLPEVIVHSLCGPESQWMLRTLGSHNIYLFIRE